MIELLPLFLFFTCALGVSVLLYKIFLRFSETLGIRNHDVSIIRWSAHSKPALGGICFYLIFLLAFIVYFMFFLENESGINMRQIGWVLATSVAFLMGLSDDAYNTRPWLKFSVQVACGLILAFTGSIITFFPYYWANVLITVFWVVAVMNSLNMLDNMDGITTVVSLFIAASAILIEWLSGGGNSFELVMLLGVAAALSGFLIFNWHPSKMFMGDTGSQFLGVFMATIGIVYFWNNQTADGTEIQARQVILMLLAFIIPISDSMTVTYNRIKRGQSPFVGGKDHTTHHLSYLGLKDNMVGWTFVLISVVSFLMIYLIVNFIDRWNHWHTALFFTWFLLVFSGLFGTTKIKKAKQRFHEQLNKS